ncbi:MAG: suppressor of fused domain protein [Clostridium sp.]|uniref:suppressor of fused domain protein n=1 Tax=Clostridium sp. TaxID=1506 RepID=UPI003EE5B7AD
MIMNFEKYKRNLKENTTFAPGLEALYSHLDNVYANQEPISYNLLHLPTNLFSNKHFLSGFSIYNSTSHSEHNHIISFGFSELYANEHYFMREKSKYGYEVTLRIDNAKIEKAESLMLAINTIYKYIKETSFSLEENTFFDYREAIDENSDFAGFIIVKDEFSSLDTVHGSVDFLQLYPIDSYTLSTLKSCKFNLSDIISILKEDNPLLIIK